MVPLPERELPPCDFFGQYRLKVERGRLTLPALCRKALPAGAEPTFILRPGRDEFVQMIPLHEWKALSRRREGLAKASGRSLQWQQRTLHGDVEAALLDPKGRFKVPDALLKAARIKDEAIIVGVGRILELWDPKVYFDQKAKHPVDPADVDDLLYQ